MTATCCYSIPGRSYGMQDRLSCHFSLARGLDFQAAEARLINESRTATGNTVAGIMIHMAGIGANHVEHPVSPHGRRPAEAPPSVNRCHDDYGREHRQQPKQSSPRTTRIPGISRSLPPHPGRGPPVTTRHLSLLSKRASVPPHPPPSDRRSRQNQHHPFPSPSPLDPRHPLSRCAVDVRRPRRGRVLMDRCPARGSTKCVRRPRGRGHGGAAAEQPMRDRRPPRVGPLRWRGWGGHRRMRTHADDRLHDGAGCMRCEGRRPE
jgi:hypothetical protein